MLATLIGVSACTSIDCPLNNVVYSRFTFYGTTNGKTSTVALEDTLTVTAAGTDSILVNKDYGASTLSLPISYYNPTDVLTFLYASTSGQAHDTLWIDKTNYEHFESPDCPTAMFHNIQNVRYTRNFIDTIVVENPVINYNENNNFKIYFRSN